MAVEAGGTIANCQITLTAHHATMEYPYVLTELCDDKLRLKSLEQ